MTLRKTFFWAHLIAGSIGGVIILLMSVTGVLLTYEKQMTAWADRGFRVEPASTRVPIESLIPADKPPQTIVLKSDPAEPVTLGYGRESTVYINPYTGATLGEGSARVRAFFQSVTSWHRWIGVDGPNRPVARAVTGACNFAFLGLVLSGAYLWLPRKWSWKNVKAVALFRGGLSGKPRDFNWHNVTGIWCVIPLALVVGCSVVMSYPWASNMVYKLAGSKPPEQGNREGGGNRQGRGEQRPIDFTGLNDAFAKAAQQQPGWQSISLRVPANNRAPLQFTIDQSNGGQPQKRGTLTLDRATLDVRSWETYESQDLGRQWRTWVRFTHTGEYYGLIGQTIAGIASAGGAFLVWTGISLALRRFSNWRARKTAKPEAALQTAA